MMRKTNKVKMSVKKTEQKNQGRGQIERKGKDGKRGNVSARRKSKEEEEVEENAECLNQAV